MDIKLIALDLDGTLLDRDHTTIPQRNLDALRRAAESGVSLAIASGRSWSLIRETVQALGRVRYGLTANGAYVLDTDTGEAVVQEGMDRTQCMEIIRILRRYGLPYELYLDGGNYVQRSDTEKIRCYTLSPAFWEVFSRNVTLVDDMLEAVEHGIPEKFDIFYVPEQVRPALIQELKGTGPFEDASGREESMELTTANVNKGKALANLSAMLGLLPEQVMAFGDADNDLEMLAWAGWSFAMENGTDAAKTAARYLAPANDKAGVGQVIERYLF